MDRFGRRQLLPVVDVMEVMMMVMEEVMMMILMGECWGLDPYDALVFDDKQTNRHSSCLGSECIYVSMINLSTMQVSRSRIAELEPLLCNIHFAFTFGLF